MHLSPIDCRVLGVLIEKAQTTPAQYPMTLNALITGCNQKSNRYPVLTVSEDDVLESLDRMRIGGMVREVMMSGSRVAKFRHVARELLEVSTPELVVLAELLLRGPQTVGELRGRASRMHALESLDVVQAILATLGEREPPLVKQVPPAPGSRAVRFVQLLCPDLHPLDVASAASTPAAASVASTPPDPGLADRVSRLEKQVAELRSALGIEETT